MHSFIADDLIPAYQLTVEPGLHRLTTGGLPAGNRIRSRARSSTSHNGAWCSNFVIEHIPGKHNKIAYEQSRHLNPEHWARRTFEEVWDQVLRAQMLDEFVQSRQAECESGHLDHYWSVNGFFQCCMHHDAPW
ncbi:hypothetical protein PR048_016885 [Dryococelus australis]|uniref:Uncharacterized protein n=1 Tax=Dryococelus australis TaxID=614101 RepID=A0ABQ9H846_9NEOP|nr:hypothetical protein PR048_016885 [Dryococelus australis]